MGTLITSISGLRGIVGDGLDESVALRWGYAFGEMLGKGARVLVGRDARPSGGMLQEAVMDGLAAAGAVAYDAGLCSTPSVEVVTRVLGMDGAVIVTASHNPPEYNGIKFLGNDGVAIDAAAGAELKKRAEKADVPRGGRVKGGREVVDDALGLHLKRVVDMINADDVVRSSFKVVVDGCSSVGGPMLVRLGCCLGCEVVEKDCEPTGRFTRNPEPRAEVLGEMGKLVASVGADVGFAVDPDGDRLCVCLADGEVLSEEYTVPLAAMQVLGGGMEGENVVVNFSTSRLVDEVARRYGSRVFRSPVGERNVVVKMREVDAVVGGEGNGGVMVPLINPCRDAAVGMAYILLLMATNGEPLADVVGTLPRFFMHKEKVTVDRSSFAAAVEKLRSLWEVALLDETDGLYAGWDDRWIHVRPSNTEPAVRIVAESVDDEKALSLVEECKRVLGV